MASLTSTVNCSRVQTDTSQLNLRLDCRSLPVAGSVACCHKAATLTMTTKLKGNSFDFVEIFHMDILMQVSRSNRHFEDNRQLSRQSIQVLSQPHTR